MCRDIAPAQQGGDDPPCSRRRGTRAVTECVHGVDNSRFDRTPVENDGASRVYPRRWMKTAGAGASLYARVSGLIAVDRCWLVREYFASLRGGGEWYSDRLGRGRSSVGRDAGAAAWLDGDVQED